MRRLPAVLLAAATAVPVLTAAVSPPPAAAASPGRTLSALSVTPASSVQAAAVVAPASSVAAAVAGPTAKPVAAKVRRLALAGVDAAALRTLTAQAGPPGTRGAPGAIAGASTRAPAVLTRKTGTKGFATLGVTWAATAAEPDLVIAVRTRGPKGWSGWESLDSDAGADPTVPSSAPRTAVRGGTDPLWVGPSTGVQARVTLRSGRLPAGLRLELVDPGTSGHDAIATPSTTGGLSAAALSSTGLSSTTLSGAGLSSAGSLKAVTANKPAVLSRAEWGANESRVRYAPTLMPTIRAAVLHHTAGRNGYSRAQVPSMLRGDYAYHLSRGWSDIGYNALVDRFGRIWEGRAGGLDQDVMGAHAGGFNYETFGVAMLGNYDVTRPSAASVAAVARVLAWKLDLAHRNPLGTARLTSAGGGTARYASDRTVTLPVIMGHRNTGYTACPGRYLYPALGAIRTQTRTLMKAALLDPVGAPATVLRGTTVSLSARALVAQTWRLDVTAPFGGGLVASARGTAKAGAKITASWNGGTTGGGQARPGRYRLTLTSSSNRGAARPVVDDVLVVPPAPAAEVPGVPSSGAGGYYPLAPTRLLDTRTAGRIGLGPKGRVDVPVLGQAGVPAAGVGAVVLNLTASGVSDDTSLSVWPTGRSATRPLTGVPAGLTRSVLVTTRVGANGAVSIGNATGVTELTVDVVGYFAVGGAAVQAIPSTRLYNSDTDPAGDLVADQPRLIPLPATLGGIAADRITGLVVDVSALSPAGPGTLTAYRPGAAGDLPTLSYRTGESIDNLAFVPVSGGAIALRAGGSPVNATLDVRAVLVEPSVVGQFTPIQPVPAVDTRTTGGAIKVGSPRKVVVTGTRTGVPVTATAVLVDLTAIAPATRTWFQVHGWGASTGGGTSLRVAKGDVRGNLVVVPIGPDGAIAIRNARGAGAQVRVDVLGYLR